MTWFVLRARYGWESSIADTIIGFGDGYRSFCPVYRSMVLNRGRRTERLTPLWATYVLADWLDDGGISWHRVMNIDGVSGVIGGEFPMPVQESEVEGWIRETNSSGIITSLDVLLDQIRRGYGRGDRVKIEGGSFDGAKGTCNWYDASGVSVKTTLLGREVNIYASLTSGARVVFDGSGAIIRSKSGARRARRNLRKKVTEHAGIFA